MAESYSGRQGRKPPIDAGALVELVFRKLLDFEQQGFFYEAFNSYTDPSGTEHPARLPRPEEYVITHLARPGLWTWLGDLERVVEAGAFPPWDLDTLFDVIELFHNLVVSAPLLDGEGGFEGWSQSDGQRLFLSAMNEVLELRDPPTRLTDEGRIVELTQTSCQEVYPPRCDVFIFHAQEDKDAVALPLTQSLANRGYQVQLDESDLIAGDGFRERLADALGGSRSVVVVLSPEFLDADWTRSELKALVEREPTDGNSPLIIPIWHGVDASRVRHAYPPLADRLALSTDAGLDAVTQGIERALQRMPDSRPRVPAAGAGEESRSESTAASHAPRQRTRRIPIISWLHKDEGISVGDLIAIAVIATVLAAGALGLPKIIHRESASTGSGTDTNSSTEGAAVHNMTPKTSANAVVEYADNHAGSPVFADPQGRAADGVPGRIPYGTRVPVSCVALNTSGAMGSVSGLYRIAAGRWHNDYVVSDTMTNGGPLGTTTTPNIDPRVPSCGT